MGEWTIYGEKLDLEAFKSIHPGGELTLLLGEGRDCTRLFEQYHLRNNNHTLMLKSLARKQGLTIDPSVQDPFHADLLRALQLFTYDYTTTPFMLGVILLLGLADAWAWIGWIQGSWLACLLLPFIHWVFVVNVAHDAAHFAFSNSVWVNEIAALVSSPLYFNTAFWYLQHNISHHTHTNEVGLDIDLYHGAPWTRFHPLDRWTGVHRIQIATVAGMDFLWATFAETYLYPTFMLMRNSTSKRFFGDYEKVLLYNTRGLVIQLILGGAVVLWPLLAFSLLKAAVFILYPHFAAGIIFMTITQISHIQEATQRAVTDAGSSSSSSSSSRWVRQMVESSLDYSQDSLFWTIVTGGLNMQSLHHCMPALSSSRYRAFYPHFRAVCKKHGVAINEVSDIWTAIGLYWAHIYRLSLPKIE